MSLCGTAFDDGGECNGGGGYYFIPGGGIGWSSGNSVLDELQMVEARVMWSVQQNQARAALAELQAAGAAVGDVSSETWGGCGGLTQVYCSTTVTVGPANSGFEAFDAASIADPTMGLGFAMHAVMNPMLDGTTRFIAVENFGKNVLSAVTTGAFTKQATKLAMAAKGAVLGRGSSASLAKGSSLARNLREQLAIEQAIADAAQGQQLPLTMGDPRWSAADGWVKMEQRLTPGGEPINVHYVYNTITGAIDDFKIILSGP
jgi:hypothetical protein